MKRILLICITILVSTTTYGYTQMGTNMTGQGMMNWGYGMGWGWSVIMLAFWALVILGIVFIIKLISGGTKSGGKTETALDVLKKRYARGEINKEEFEEKKKGLA